jgi:metallo-beta-lactamase class B
MMRRPSLLAALTVAAAATSAGAIACAQTDSASRSWNRPVRPFKIADNIYYVGASDVTSFLITTPRGHVLVDGGLVETAPLILASIRALGFRPEDVRLILASHAHYDHAGGLAELKRVTGAALAAGAGDSALLVRGGMGDPNFGDRLPFPAVTPDRLVRDGDTLTLGGVTLVARVTPGHTRGCTTWTTTVREGDRERGVVFICSASTSGYRLAGNEKYPDIAADYRRTFGILRSLRCDVFLGAHGVFFSLEEKIRRLEQQPAENPFVDPDGCRAYIDHAERTFETRLREQADTAERPKPGR